jgi:DNA-binding GntR family transcriptional regulator
MREYEQIVDAMRRRAVDEPGMLMFEHLQRKCDARRDICGSWAAGRVEPICEF